MEGVHEIRQVAKSNLECNIADAPVRIGQERGRAAQTRSQQILMRSEPCHSRKQPQKMKRAHADPRRDLLEPQGLARVRVDEQGGLDRTTAVS